MSTPTGRTDDELSTLDVAALLRTGLAGPRTDAGKQLFGDGAVAAAIALEHTEAIARSVGFLAETVRAAGIAVVARLPEPLPTPEQRAVIEPWVAVAADLPAEVETDDSLARWLEGVAAILALRASRR